MIKKLFVTCSCLALALFSAHAQTTNRLHFASSGFSIAAPEAPFTGTNQPIVMMYLPPINGLSPNVNVMLQPYTDSMQSYILLTRKQFEEAKFRLIDLRSGGKSAVIFEYAGALQDQQFHWYARAEKVGDRVYLVTATATPDQWASVGAALKKCVESFHCDLAN